MEDSSGHGDFKQDQEAHRCDKASVVEITDILMVAIMVTLKQDQEAHRCDKFSELLCATKF